MDFEKTVKGLSDICSSEMHHYSVEGVPFPSNEKLAEIIDLCRSLLFPAYYGRCVGDASSLKYHTGVATSRLYDRLTTQIAAGLACAMTEQTCPTDALWDTARTDARQFIEDLTCLRRALADDVRAHYNNDPAAHNFGEVILCYPGMKAVSSYRIAHKLSQMGIPLIPRMITELAHSETGIDINPEAEIGGSFAIDHGTGVVIGATCIIGDNVTIYQGVTLGARNFPKNNDGSLVKGIARHPIIGDNVIIYANATILGRIKIGSGSVIGGNIWLTHDVPENTRLFNQ